MEIDFTGERIVPGAANCEPSFAQKMYQEHVARYAFASQLVEGRDVLDVACGVGYGSQWLAKAGAKSVLGIDIAADAIDHAKKNYFHPSISFKTQDATKMGFAGEFDVVTCFEFIEHIDQQEKVLDAIKRALRPEGVLIISTPRPLDDKRTHFHVHELEFEELRRMLVERFPHVDSYFERNCFTSLVGDAMPEVLDHIVRVTDRLDLASADYFIFVARMAKTAGSEGIKPVLTVNDDSYVLRLEDDIVNLRNGENYHNQLIHDLSGKSESLEQKLGDVQSDLEVQRSRAEGLDLLRAETSKIITDVASLREEMRSSACDVASLREEMRSSACDVASLREELKVSAELSAAQAELGNVRSSRDALALEKESLLDDNDTLRADNERVRTVLSKVSQQLAETETRLNAKLAEADVVENLRNELAILRENHSREMHALNEKYELSERTLNRFRRSVSWGVTRPIRWVGRQYRKVTGRSVA